MAGKKPLIVKSLGKSFLDKRTNLMRKYPKRFTFGELLAELSKRKIYREQNTISNYLSRHSIGIVKKGDRFFTPKQFEKAIECLANVKQTKKWWEPKK